jgi:hypothetical protein
MVHPVLVCNLSFLIATNYFKPDRENAYADRAYIANAQAESPGSGLWTLKHIS